MSIEMLRASSSLLIGIPLYHRFTVVTDCFLTPRFSFHFRRLFYAFLINLLFAIRVLIESKFSAPSIWVIYIFIIFLLYRGSFFSKLFYFLFCWAIFVASECTTVAVLTSFGWGFEPTSTLSLLSIDLITALAYFVFSFIPERLKYVLDDQMSIRTQFLFLCSALSLTLCTFVMYTNAFSNQIKISIPSLNNFLKLTNAIGVFFPLLSLIALFSLVHQFNLSIRDAKEARLRETRAQMKLEHHLAIAEKNQAERRLHHDFKNHLLAIDALGQAGNIERQHAYISHLSEMFSGTEISFFTGHMLIDSILQSKAKRMEAAGIDIKWQLSPLPPALEISDLALCALLGNILDNAIEACERIEDSSARNIMVSTQMHDAHFAFQVTNSANNVNKLLSTMFFISQKKKVHPGLGLTNCQKIVEHYHGTITIHATNNDQAIQVSVVLPCVPKIP